MKTPMILNMFCALLLSVPAAALGQDYIVSGTGAPHSSWAECKEELPLFEKRLRTAGLIPIGDVLCASPDNDPNVFTLSFKASSNRMLVARTIVGTQQFNSLTFCHLERLAMLQELSTDRSLVLESSCPSTKKELSDAHTEVYAPAIIVLEPPRGLAAQ